MTHSPHLPTRNGGGTAPAWLMAAAWTAFMTAALVWLALEHHRETLEVARVEARISLQKDILFRLSGSAYDGVYVPENKNVSPRLHLAHGEASTVQTTSGQRLTLVNPMAMVRQVQAMGANAMGTTAT